MQCLDNKVAEIILEEMTVNTNNTGYEICTAYNTTNILSINDEILENMHPIASYKKACIVCKVKLC